MIDADIDFCDRQIEPQQETVAAIHSAIQKVEHVLKLADDAIAKAKKEKNRITHMLKVLQSRFGQEKGKLRQMTRHRNQLKTLKKLQMNQHATIKEEKK